MVRFITWVVTQRRTVVVLVALATALLLLPLRHLEVIIDTDHLLPQAHPYVIATKAVERLFGNRYTVVVGMSARDGTVLTPHRLEKLKGLSDALATVPGAQRANLRSLASPKIKNIVGSDDCWREASREQKAVAARVVAHADVSKSVNHSLVVEDVVRAD